MAADASHPEPDPLIPASIELGGVMVIAVDDAHGSFMNFRAAFPGAPDELEQDGWLRYPELFAGAAWTLPFRSYLVRSSDRRLLIDAGVGPPPGQFLPKRQGRLPAELARLGCQREQIDIVFLTHLHVDHIGWAAINGAPFFPNARYLTSGDDWRFFAARAESRAVFADKLAPLERAGVVELVEAHDVELAPGVAAVATPGHTPGHMSVLVRSPRRQLCILGDVAVHPLQVKEPDLVYAYDEDGDKATASRRRLLGEIAAGDAVVAAGHFPTRGGFGRVVAVDERHDRFAWQPLDR
ncbi:MAG: MBL fold metallo-hydrolase [Actinomycetota bacterium]|nr:MBL fold metallo-hydrolase [Actinomycetota bacterium]